MANLPETFKVILICDFWTENEKSVFILWTKAATKDITFVIPRKVRAAGMWQSLKLLLMRFPMRHGLITTVCGLAGVFVVLTLFFVTIKLMQRIHTRDER